MTTMGPDGKTPVEGDDYVLLRPDRRKDLRVHLLVLRIQGERDNIFFGYAKNLSRGGMFISTVNPRNVGEEFKVSFAFPGDGKKIECKCVVLWKREYDPKRGYEPGMGLKFIEIMADDRKKIDAWIKESKDKP